MQKLALVVAVAAAIVIPSSLPSSSAQAGGPQRWGDRDYEIVRWSYGDCKIWYDDSGPPWGAGWKVVKGNLRTWDAAWAKLGRLQKRGKCT
jgi:hypothetical protein